MFEVFEGKRVLVTGHTGFKGAWLATWLDMLGAKVSGFSLSPLPYKSFWSACQSSSFIDEHFGDIRDETRIAEVIRTVRPEFIFHLAAQPLVMASYEDPITTMTTNAMGTMHLLNTLRGFDQPITAVLITSDKCYENLEWEYGYRETDRLGGFDPYSSSKAMAEIGISSLVRSFFLSKTPHIKVASVRAGNVIGGGDWSPNRIIPDSVSAWSSKGVVSVRSPNATRPWQHVLEPLHGYLRTAEYLSQNSQTDELSFNFGPDKEANKTVADVMVALKQRLDGFEFEINVPPKNTRHEAGLLHLCCDRAKSILSWTPILNFDETFDYLAQWYVNAEEFNSKEMDDFSRHQIAAFMQRALHA